MTINIKCSGCGTPFGLPDALHEAARASERITFYCPYGHPQHYPAGETDEDRLRRERDRLVQQVAQRDDEIREQRALAEGAERRASAARGQVTRIKNRVGHGVCPSCNRTFGDLARHMHSKHPAYARSDVILPPDGKSHPSTAH